MFGRHLTQDIGNEDAVELGLFEKLGQLSPVLNLGEARGLVVGMSP